MYTSYFLFKYFGIKLLIGITKIEFCKRSYETKLSIISRLTVHVKWMTLVLAVTIVC